MNKFKNFCKKPLLIISICITAVFFVALIVMSLIPHGKVYEYTYKIDGVKYKYQITLDKKFKENHTYELDGKTYDVFGTDKKQYDYFVTGRELFIVDGGTANERQKIGSVDSTKIKLTYNVGNSEKLTTLTCKTNKILSNIFIVGFYLGIALCASSATVICIDKQKDKKVLKK